MRQVIVRLRDCRPTYTKTIRTRYYYSQAQYKQQVYDDFKDLLPGQEIYIKIGNQFSAYISYEDNAKDSEIDYIDFDDELYDNLTNNYNINYYIEKYLPKY